MMEILLATLVVVNQILDAGNSITAFALLLYALTFNLRERVARTFALVLACLSVVYFGDVLASLSPRTSDMEVWLRLQWVGIAFLPTAVFHLSDALLASTGRPSRGKRTLLIRLSYAASLATLVVATLTPYVGRGVVRVGPVGYLAPGPLFWLFVVFIAGTLVVAGINYWRTYKRCLTRDSRRRMAYLTAGSFGPLLGAFPFLMLGGAPLLRIPIAFWAILAFINITVGFLLVLMAYAVAYFGVSYPDRVVKARLFQWILRGPFVASSVLAVTVLVNRASAFVGIVNSGLVPFALVASLLLLQYVITLVRHPIERWLFYGEDRSDVVRLQILEERLLTTGDVKQFLEAVLNATCDITGAKSAFIAATGPQGLELEVSVGPEDPLRTKAELPALLMTDRKQEVPLLGTVFAWDAFWLIPLHSPDSQEVQGMMGIRSGDQLPELTPDQAKELNLLVDRAAVALTDRILQREVFATMDRLVPQVEAIQRMRAAARYAGLEALTSPANGTQGEADLVNLVRDALGHYWGGPRLTSSPLLSLNVVRQAMLEHDGSPVNALRSILKRAIERTRPEGERRFTGEWMLYNILEMKFLEGRKVRDVALRLAMSEADLYRKQRVAIEAVALAISDMEREANARVEPAGT
jgi:N-terminal 7TM region of histidine kinase